MGIQNRGRWDSLLLYCFQQRRIEFVLRLAWRLIYHGFGQTFMNEKYVLFSILGFTTFLCLFVHLFVVFPISISLNITGTSSRKWSTSLVIVVAEHALKIHGFFFPLFVPWLCKFLSFHKSLWIIAEHFNVYSSNVNQRCNFVKLILMVF